MKSTLIASAILSQQPIQLLLWRRPSSTTPPCARSSTRTRIAKTWDPAIRTPMVAIIETVGRTAKRSRELSDAVTMQCAIVDGKKAPTC
jgi:hypothetical protein